MVALVAGVVMGVRSHFGRRANGNGRGGWAGNCKNNFRHIGKKAYLCKLNILAMQFKDIVGQRDVINRLTEIIDSGRVSHAQLLLGDTRDGALQLAWAYVQYLCCEHREHHAAGDLRADSCGQCPSCKKIASLQHPDLHLFFPNNTTDSVKKDPCCQDFMGEFREFMTEHRGLGTLDEWFATLGIDNKQGIINVRDAGQMVSDLSLKSYEGGWKMVIVWMVEKMRSEAANELLKTLEEPSAGSLILLVAESDERLLATVRSRVQTVRLQPGLAEQRQQEAWAAQFAPMLVEWLRLLFKLKMRELGAQVDKMAALNREQQKQLLTYALGVMRDCFLKTAAGMPCRLGSGDEKFDAMFPSMVTANNIQLINDALNDAIFAIERNAYGKIALMELSFRMSKALKKR